MPQNYYKSDRIQKKLPRIKDEQLEWTGCNINKHMLLCGGTGSGKTNCLYDYIIQTSKPKKGTFKKILVCYKTDEILYEYLTQSFFDSDSFIRKQMSYLILLENKGKTDLNNILSVTS